MALSTLPDGNAPNLIHHSDRDCQYCSSLYVDSLKSRKIQISMTQSGAPLGNAVAERANGILNFQKRVSTKRFLKAFMDTFGIAPKSVNFFQFKTLTNFANI